MEMTINCLACQDSGTMYLSDDCYGECLYCSANDVKPMKKQSPKRKKNKTKTRKVNPLYVNYRL